MSHKYAREAALAISTELLVIVSQIVRHRLISTYMEVTKINIPENLVKVRIDFSHGSKALALFVECTLYPIVIPRNIEIAEYTSDHKHFTQGSVRAEVQIESGWIKLVQKVEEFKDLRDPMWSLKSEFDKAYTQISN